MAIWGGHPQLGRFMKTNLITREGYDKLKKRTRFSLA
jgi:hypothetical protein